MLRRAGWQKEMAAAGLGTNAVEHICAPTEAGGRSSAIQLLQLPKRPTALLCATDAIAIGALHAVKEMDLMPGRDISIIGHDGLPSGEFTDPPLTTMTIDATDLGGRLANLLIRRLAGAAPTELQELHPILQVSRRTHGPPKR